jgi:hypothetical protein
MLSNEDKKIVADYMNWYYAGHEGIYYYDWDGRRQRNLDLTAAGLVVQEMQKRGEWQDFVQTAAKIHKLGFHSEVVAWLFNAENFFKAFTEWRKGIKLDPVIDKESAAYMDN